MIPPEELDTILQSLSAAAPGGQEAVNPPVRPYDFRRPGKFAKDQVRTLTMLHEIFSRLMAGFLAAHLRARVQMGVESVQQQTFQEFIQEVPNPTVLGTFRMPPLPGICLLHVPNHLGFSIVDRVFGGSGSGDHPARALTEIEQSVLRRIFQHAMSTLQESWHRVMNVRPQMEGIEVNPLFIQAALPGEVLAVINLHLSLNQNEGHLSVVIPYSTIEPILARLSPHSWLASARESLPEQEEDLRQQIEEAPVQLVAHLGRAVISVGEFLQLGAGHTVVLNQRVGDDIDVYVDSQLAFRGRPGTHRGRMVVAIRQRGQ